jgi:hypothetical protein
MTAPKESTNVTGPAGQGANVAVSRGRSELVADVILTALLLALFGWAFLEAGEWSFRAYLFPRIVSGAAFVFCGLHLVQAALRLRRGAVDAPARVHVSAPAAADAAAGGEHENEVNEDDVEYVFSTAGGRAWAAALGWVAGFFVLLYVAGLFLTAPLFSLLYLRFAGRQSWRMSVGYAVVIGVVLYVAFEVLLGIATPPGLFLD